MLDGALSSSALTFEKDFIKVRIETLQKFDSGLSYTPKLIKYRMENNFQGATGVQKLQKKQFGTFFGNVLHKNRSEATGGQNGYRLKLKDPVKQIS